MSVYPPQQQSYGQQIGQPSQLGQQPYSPQGIQQPWLSQGQQQFGQQYPQFVAQQGQQLPLVVTELALRCAATAATAVVEQLRMDPQIMMGIQTQGQIPPHAWGNVLVECARRVAPVLHTTLAQITQGQIGQQGQFGQPYPQFGQQGQFGQQYPQFGQQGQFGQGQFGQQQGQFPGMSPNLFGQPQYGQLSPMGM